MSPFLADELRLRHLDIKEIMFKASLNLQEDIVTYGNVRISNMDDEGAMVSYGFLSERCSWDDIKTAIGYKG